MVVCTQRIILVNLDLQFGDRLRSGEIAGAVDRIEKAIHGKHPQVKWIFLEAKSIPAPTG